MSNQAPIDYSAPATPPPAAKKRSASRIITPILALVAALAIGLFGGILIGHSTASAQASGFGQRFGGAGAIGGQGGAGGTGGGTGAFGGFTTGTIVSVSGNTVVLKETNGTQVTVTTSGSTTVTTTQKSSVDKLAAGQQIRVVGQADASGNVTATSIAEGSNLGFPGGRTGAPTTGTGANN